MCAFREQKSKGAKVLSIGILCEGNSHGPILKRFTGLKNFKERSGKDGEEKRVSPRVLCPQGESGAPQIRKQPAALRRRLQQSPAPRAPQADLSKPAGCPPTPTAHLPEQGSPRPQTRLEN